MRPSAKRFRLLGLGCAALFLGSARIAVAESAVAEPVRRLVRPIADWLDRALVPRCLTPEAARAMSELVERGALRPVLADDLTLVRGDLRGSEIELEIRDRADHSYAITLALAGTRGGRADGHGRLFTFHLKAPEAGPASPRANGALLAAAALFDQAIPDSALERCAAGGERRYPRSLILASALFQWLVIIAAALYGLGALPDQRSQR